ncbi:MAG: F0F1 ATP synthase subunit epsilon [Limimaricola sp.]|uniref:F0F1 ATP synthase subunit epsilon n=1 Tax=Limimaricola sp. TaxID=2211665 RepID=UPI001DE27453|nr:F0F1 ATP synthase subunit epsilon [Limimaricola sp.]MBI1418203.1 F0F1 ATP synthase subunit epsilon [Limimaricola sp.]
MSGALHLVVTTPLAVVVDETDVAAVRAADASGSFGLLHGHVDLLTVLASGVLRWRDGAGALRYCAVRGGVLSVSGGREVRVACREAVTGTDLDRLEAMVAAAREAAAAEAARARVAQTRLHAQAIRTIMQHLAGRTDPAELIAAEDRGDG